MTPERPTKHATFSDQLVQDLTTSAPSSPSTPERKPLKSALRRRTTFDPSRASFTDLPGEIRNRIYHFVLDIHVAAAATAHWPPNLYHAATMEHHRAEQTRGTIMPMNPVSAQYSSPTDKAAVTSIRKTHISLLDFSLANKQIRNEFTPLYLPTFTFHFSYEPASLENLRAWVSCLGHDAKHVRSVSVTLDPGLRRHHSGEGAQDKAAKRVVTHLLAVVLRSLDRVEAQGLCLGGRTRIVRNLDAANAVWRMTRVGAPVTRAWFRGMVNEKEHMLRKRNQRASVLAWNVGILDGEGREWGPGNGGGVNVWDVVECEGFFG